MKIRSRFPSRQEILPVFSLILFIVFSWAIFRMLFQIPSWLYSHTKTGILFLAAYVFAFSLIESLFLLGFLLVLCFILPQRLFRERFIAQGGLMVLACTAWALLLQYQRESFGQSYVLELSGWLLLFLLSLIVILVVSLYIFQRFDRVQSALEVIADRMIVFAWLYIPVGLVSSAIVIVRNIV